MYYSNRKCHCFNKKLYNFDKNQMKNKWYKEIFANYLNINLWDQQKSDILTKNVNFIDKNSINSQQCAKSGNTSTKSCLCIN